jgi:hypothetical protein
LTCAQTLSTAASERQRLRVGVPLQHSHARRLLHSAAYNEQRRRRQYTMLAPLAYAPLLPLVRLGLRKNPPLRDAVFGSCVLLALAHAGLIMSQDSTL